MSCNRIAISAGHSLYVRGAAGPAPWGLDEVDEARRLMEHLADELEARGVEVVTYADDLSKTQNENLNRLVDWHNAQAPHDLDCSIHFNAYNGTAHGVEVCHLTQPELAADISAAIASCGFTDRGGKLRNDLFFLAHTSAPAVLIETAFCDNRDDCDTYRAQFGAICEAIANVLAGEEDDTEQPESEYLFTATGKCSHFGGPLDLGVSASEGLAFHFAITEDNQHLFLPLQPAGTTGLARRLNAKAVHYIACRWDYGVTPKEMLATDAMALVTNMATGIAQTAFCADWGPHEEKTGGRVADLSPALMTDLGLTTDDIVEVLYPWTP